MDIRRHVRGLCIYFFVLKARESISVMRKNSPKQHQKLIRMLRYNAGATVAHRKEAFNKALTFCETFNRSITRQKKMGFWELNKKQYVAYSKQFNGLSRREAKHALAKAMQDKRKQVRTASGKVKYLLRKPVEHEKVDAASSAYNFTGDPMLISQAGANSLLNGQDGPEQVAPGETSVP